MSNLTTDQNVKENVMRKITEKLQLTILIARHNKC